jgi:hypothetical protein
MALKDKYEAEWLKLLERAARGSQEKLRRVLEKVKDLPVETADQL